MTVATEFTSSATSDHLYGKIAWRLLPILILFFLIANIDRANVGFAALQMKNELGFSNAAYGLGAGIFFIGYFVFEIPSNMVLEKVGARVWFTRILVTWGAATLVMAFVNNTTSFYIIRFIIGAAEAGASPGVMWYFSQWVPNRQRGRFNAIFWVSIPMAFVIAGPFSGIIMTQLDGVAGYAGWRWLFLAEGAMTLLAAPLVFFGLTNSIAEAKWLTESEKSQAAEAVAVEARSALAHDYRDVFNKAETVYACLAYFCAIVGYYGMAFWLPQILKKAGIADTATIGWLSALPWVVAAVAVVIVGPLSDAPGRRKIFRNLLMSLGAIGYCTSAYFADNIVLSLVGMTIAAVGIICGPVIFWSGLARIYVGAAAAVGFAVVNSIGNLGGFASPFMLGLITDAAGSPVVGMYVIAFSIIISAILMGVCLKEVEN
jgi:MFS family permease